MPDIDNFAFIYVWSGGGGRVGVGGRKDSPISNPEAFYSAICRVLVVSKALDFSSFSELKTGDLDSDKIEEKVPAMRCTLAHVAGLSETSHGAINGIKFVPASTVISLLTVPRWFCCCSSSWFMTVCLLYSQ